MTAPYDPIDGALGLATTELGPWQRRLVIYLRLLAGFLLAKTVYSWALICGLLGSDMGRFEALSLGAQAAVVWTAIMNPAAAIGLWLGAAWGVVLWLAATAVQIAINGTAPEGIGSLYVLLMVEAVLVLIYAGIAYKAMREDDE